MLKDTNSKPTQSQASARIAHPDFKVRAEARRRNWTGRRLSLEEKGQDEMPSGSRADRFNAVFELSELSWTLSGRKLPSYTRAEMPGRLLALSEL